MESDGMPAKPCLVSVVEDDAAAREAVLGLVRSLSFEAAGFDGAASFLHSPLRARTGCLIADLRMPGMGGLELWLLLEASAAPIPSILMTAFAEDLAPARRLAAGRCYCLAKPLDPELLLGRIRAALEG
jgi:FixJ family two-component response regulator